MTTEPDTLDQSNAHYDDGSSLDDVRSTDSESLTSVRANEDASNIQRTFDVRKMASNVRNQFKAPEARAGYVQKWITAAITGEDVSNIFAAQEQGWEPRTYDTLNDNEKRKYKESSAGAFEGLIRVKNTILCERPVELHNAWVKQFEEEDAERIKSVGGGLPNMQNDAIVSGAISVDNPNPLYYD